MLRRRVIAQLVATTKRIQRPLLEIQITDSAGAYTVAVENNPRTDSLESTTIVNTPRIVPKGIKRDSMQDITRTNE